MCFRVNRENTKKMINQHKNVYFGSIRAFRESWESTVTFSDQNDTGRYFSKVDFQTVRRFRNNISNPDNFVRRTTTLAGEPPHAVAKTFSELPFLFPFYYYLILFLFNLI